MTSTLSMKIPSLYCPIPTSLHPCVEELNADGLSWISQFVMFADNAEWQRYVAMNPGLLPGYVMPRAPMGPALQAASNLLFWLWAYDDIECDEVEDRQCFDEHILQLSDLARVAEAPSVIPHTNPFSAALADLRAQLVRTATPVQVARWASAMSAYFMANAAAAVQRRQGVIPDLDTYVAQRIHSGAVKPTLMLLDVAEGYELSPSEVESPDVTALNEMVCSLVGWDNDLLTYHKEVLRGGADHNLVTVLAQAMGCSPTEAVDEAVDIRDRVLGLYLQLHEKVKASASPALGRYLAGLSSWVRGHLDWGMTTMRYRDPEAAADLPDELAGAAPIVSTEPLAIPTVAWWWERLGSDNGGALQYPSKAQAKIPAPRSV
jgi:hypothetical protein